MNFLASPPLVVAYALAGTTDIDMNAEPIGTDNDGQPVYLKDIWPTPHEIQQTIGASVELGDVPQELRERLYGRRTLAGDRRAEGRGLPVAGDVDLRAKSAVLPGHDHDAAAPWRTSAAHVHWRCSAIP